MLINTFLRFREWIDPIATSFTTMSYGTRRGLFVEALTSSAVRVEEGSCAIAMGSSSMRKRSIVRIQRYAKQYLQYVSLLLRKYICVCTLDLRKLAVKNLGDKFNNSQVEWLLWIRFETGGDLEDVGLDRCNANLERTVVRNWETREPARGRRYPASNYRQTLRRRTRSNCSVNWNTCTRLLRDCYAI